ncbi:MAG: N-acetyl-gamma-glutamyl-phosphate reductase [Pseudomonadota bacterium]
MSITVALVGARGHTGAELIALLADHPTFDLVLASSRALVGERVADHIGGFVGDLRFCEARPDEVASCGADAVVLALPNDLSGPFVAALPDAVIVDLSADHRFDDRWHYGLPELTRQDAGGRKRIANPGCYATAMQLALAPFRDVLKGTPQCFGVSGYSGAGTTPSDKNDPEKLADNVQPYAPFDHIHEREVSRHINHRVRFLPHVGAYFRGISMTVSATLSERVDANQRLDDAYANEPLVRISATPPWVSDNAGKHHASVGGVAQRENELTIYATLDNLLKGAATQAVQNLNLAFGIREHEGIPLG